MHVEFIEQLTHDTLRLLVKFADWDRKSVNGNSLGLLLIVYSLNDKPKPKEVLIRNNGVNVGRIARFSDNKETLSVILSEHLETAVFSDLCINRMILEKEGELDVYVADQAGARHLLGLIKYSENLTGDLYAPKKLPLRPILISSLGRSGSTVLADCLGQHPTITNIGMYPYEYRFFSYCLQAIYVLSSPANHNFSMGGDSFEIRTPFNIGFNPFNHREYDGIIKNDKVREFYENDFTININNFFTDQINLFLKIIKSTKVESTCFVEKMASSSLANLSKNLFNGVSEIVITRNFWDMTSSMIAFDNKRGTKSFFNGDDADSWIISMAFNHKLLENRSKIPENISILYDDLINNTTNTINSIAEILHIDINNDYLRLMIRPFEYNPYRKHHSTFSINKNSIKNIFSETAIHIAENILNEDILSDNSWDYSDISQFDPQANCINHRINDNIEFLLKKSQEKARLHYDNKIYEMMNLVDIKTIQANKYDNINKNLLNQLDELKKSYNDLQLCRETERKNALLEIKLHHDRAERAEIYNKSLLAELDKLKSCIENS